MTGRREGWGLVRRGDNLSEVPGGEKEAAERGSSPEARGEVKQRSGLQPSARLGGEGARCWGPPTNLSLLGPQPELPHPPIPLALAQESVPPEASPGSPHPAVG